jgi:hypothetical protein
MSHRGYIGQVFEVRPILAAMEDRGMPIDDAARVALGAEFEAAQRELGAELSQAAGDIGNVHPKHGYLRAPKDTTGLVEREFEDIGDDLMVRKVPRWCRVEPFNPNSSQQLIRYMRAKGHTVPKDKHRENDSGENPDTTAAKELMRLAAKTGDLFYLRVIEYRGLTKMRGTYVEGFAPGPDGCVHTTFTFDTGIGQLSSRNPNIQNFPKMKPTPALAKAMRRMVAAKPGRVLTEWDFKSCHIITLGFLAEDLQYMRLGRLDMHSFIAGHFLRLWDGNELVHEDDATLRAKFKALKQVVEYKHVRDDQAKHGILGIGNGLKARGLYERYMENFPPRTCPVCHGHGKVAGARKDTFRKCAECKGMGMQPGLKIAQEVLDIAERLFPKVFAWQRRIQKVAHEQQYLKTHFGHIRRFYEVFRWDASRHEMGHGDQAEEAIAFWLANIAFGHIREKLKELHAAGLDARYGLFNNVHDSFMFHFDADEIETHIAEVYPILVSPSKVLRHPTICPDGLVIDVEGAWGHTWDAMKEINVCNSLAGSSQAISSAAG